uniref:Uncharacterized protein n=2 Tax=Panagrolaimus sp. PS1159 TaxID=55785 RepID=A0AC35GF76_9BILA
MNFNADTNNVPSTSTLTSSSILKYKPSKLIFTVPSHQQYPTDVYRYLKKNVAPKMVLKLMQEFQILTAAKNIKTIGLIETFIDNGKGNLISFEELLECLPFVWRINIRKYVPSIECLKAVEKFNLKELFHLKLSDVSMDFDFVRYMDFIRKQYSIGDHKCTIYTIFFEDNISPEYTKQLQSIVDKVVNKGIYRTEYGHVHINFPNIKQESTDAMARYCRMKQTDRCQKMDDASNHSLQIDKNGSRLKNTQKPKYSRSKYVIKSNSLWSKYTSDFAI